MTSYVEKIFESKLNEKDKFNSFWKERSTEFQNSLIGFF